RRVVVSRTRRVPYTHRVIHREAAVRTVRSSNGQPAGSRPCAHCGRPVPQPYSGNQIFRYCRDNEGACQRAARRIGLHRVGGPGLGDPVAGAVVVTERLEHVVDALNEALHANLSPAGVERQIAAVRGEAAASVAAAHAQRDEARQEAHQARDEAEQARREADLARDEARQARADAAVSREQADLALARAAGQVGVADRLAAERDAARAELDNARFQAARIDEQVSNLASALARLGTATRVEPVPVPAPAGWVVRDQKSA